VACSILAAGCESGATTGEPAVEASAPAASTTGTMPDGAIPDASAAPPVTDAAAFPPWDGAATGCAPTATGVDCKSGDPNAPTFEVIIPTDGTGVVSINVETSEPARGFVGVCLAAQPSLYATPVLPALCYSVNTTGDAGSGATQTDWATFTVGAATASSYPYYETCGLPGGCAMVSHSCCSAPVALVVSGSSATGRITSIFPGASD
jgi:hypothetical protein